MRVDYPPKDPPQPLCVGVRLHTPWPEVRNDPGAPLGERGCVKVVLGGEIAINGAQSYIGTLRDIPHLDRAIIAFLEQLDGGLDDALAPPSTVRRKPGRVVVDAFFDVVLAGQITRHQLRLPGGTG